MLLTDRSAIENIVIAQLGVPPASIFNTTSNLLPRVWWVAAGGNDGAGNGYMTAPFLTVKRAVRQARDYDVILVSGSSYAETIDIGSGDTSYGSSSTQGYQKIGLKIVGAGVGAGYGHTGLVQIIGDGATAQPTLRVRGGYASGFLLKNLELDSNGVAQPAFEIISDDASAAPGASAAHYRFTLDNVAVRSNDPAVGFLFTGATLGDVKNLYINGPTSFGLAFTAGPSGQVSDLKFENIEFANSFSGTQTANIATCASNAGNGFTVAAVQSMVAVNMERVKFNLGPTNFINIPKDAGAVNLCTNCSIYDARFPTAPTSGTNGVATLPTNFVVLGHGTSGLVSLKG